MYHKAFRLIKTTRNIRTSLSSIILREIWAKPIMFIGTQLGVSLTAFKLEVEGRTPEHKKIRRNRELDLIYLSPQIKIIESNHKTRPK